jgi:transcription initiation factor IIE alpha subunit
MKTDLELEFKKETGFRPGLQKDIVCPDCDEVLQTGKFYTSDFVDFLIEKIEKLTTIINENNQRN